jgi:hypothetical protein
MAERTADSEFRATFPASPRFEDLSQRGAVKLTALLRIAGRSDYVIWSGDRSGAGFRARTGQLVPIYYLDLEATDAPLERRAAVEVDVRIRLGKHLAADGSVDRLLTEVRTEVAADGGRTPVGRICKQGVFTRPDADPAGRRVTALHPSLGLGDLPAREIRPFTPEDLLAPPDGAGSPEAIPPGEAHVWSYEQTDLNQHVHAMEYVRVVEAFVADVLARRGRPPAGWVFARARVLYRRPCFAGDWYRVGATRWSVADGEDVVVGVVHRLDRPDQRPVGPPATFVRLETRKSLLSGSAFDKGR